MRSRYRRAGALLLPATSQVRPFVANPRAALDACALTINPIRGNRGSAVK